MTVVAFTKQGESFALAAEAGGTPDEVRARLTQLSLTGSAVPNADVWLPTEKDGMLRYSDIERLEEGS